MILEVTRATEFVPGTNLPRKGVQANWRFLLASPNIGRVIHLGPAPPGLEASLSRLGAVLEVLDPGPGTELPERGADVVLVAGGSACRWVARDPALLSGLTSLLEPRGTMFLDWGGRGWLSRRETATLDRLAGGVSLLWLSPRRGDARVAARLEHREGIKYALRSGLDVLSDRPYPARAWRYVTRQRPRLGRVGSRGGALAGPGPRGRGHAPPDYLVSVAGESGVDLREHRWVMSAPGQYLSRKVVFLLFAPGESAPEYVVKMTREPALSPRLENEWRALGLLRDRAIGDPASLPRPAFFGYADGLPVLGQTHVHGAGAFPRALAAGDFAGMRAAFDWLVELAQRTADGSAVTPAGAADALGELFTRYCDLYRPPAAEQAFLAKQLESIAASPAPFPTVFQHGDPGVWNMLLTPRGTVAFLDWEAAEPQGMPLWDLFHLARSCGLWEPPGGPKRMLAARLAGRPPPDQRELAGLLSDSTQRLQDEVGLSREVVGPLFYTCWMHRALKEATRLPADQLDGGHYVRMLRRLISDVRSEPPR